MRLPMLLALMLVAAQAQAAAPTSALGGLLLKQAPPPTGTTGSGDEDDDDDEGDTTPVATPPAPGPADTTTATPEATTAPAATTPAPEAAAAAEAPTQEMTLVSGAPLNDPNVAVHIVEQKPFSDSGKREVILYPIAAQVNGKFTQHLGTMGSFVWHLQENFGLQVTGGYNWYNVESAFNAELVDKVRAEAQAATSLLWTWGVLGGVEVTPLYGKFSFFEGTLGHFSIVLSGGAGLGGTRHQLKPENQAADGSITPATFGDTGMRFMGQLGAGFRLQLGTRFAFRVEVHDVVYTARQEKVNGCDVNDLRAMDNALRGGKDPAGVQVSGSCDAQRFSNQLDPNTGLRGSNDVPLALNLVKVPSSDVLNNVGLYIGAAFLF